MENKRENILTEEEIKEDLRYLQLLAQSYPNVAEASCEIINLEALLDGVEPLDGFAVAGVAAEAPNGVGGVEDGAAAAQDGHCLCDDLFHNPGCKNTKKNAAKVRMTNFFTNYSP